MMLRTGGMFSGFTIVVGVTGGIAAYRAVDLVRTLRKSGAEVYVVMTKAAGKFVGPMTFEALSGNPVFDDVFSKTGWNFPHLELAKKADALVIAPATANFIAKAAAGLADDLLSTTLLACEGPVIVCPAMNATMYRHPSVQANLERLKEQGYSIVEPGVGHLACGETGPGRLADLQQIIAALKDQLCTEQDFSGVSVLITAGATREPIDPVRFISNHSSGKMGFSIARAARKRGARVVLITGPQHPAPPDGVELIRVTTAREMMAEVLKHYATVDVVIKAAAVADYTPKRIAEHKIKKTGQQLILELEKNPDILLELGKRKQSQVLVGFAAETEHVERNAREKLRKKNLDMIVANDVTAPGAGFGSDTNEAKLILRDGTFRHLPLMDKEAMGHEILNMVKELLQNRKIEK